MIALNPILKTKYSIFSGTASFGLDKNMLQSKSLLIPHSDLLCEITGNSTNTPPQLASYLSSLPAFCLGLPWAFSGQHLTTQCNHLNRS